MKIEINIDKDKIYLVCIFIGAMFVIFLLILSNLFSNNTYIDKDFLNYYCQSKYGEGYVYLKHSEEDNVIYLRCQKQELTKIAKIDY